MEAVEEKWASSAVTARSSELSEFHRRPAVVESGVLGTISRVEQAATALTYWYGYIAT